MISTDAAVFAPAYYLFIPLSILLSRSFQPDSLMMLFLISLFSIWRYFERPSDFGLITAAGISGLTLLYRPLVLFTLLAAFIALTFQQATTWKGIFKRQYFVFIALSLVPSVLYYGYGIVIAGFLRWKVETSFRPNLFLYRVFWRDWLLLGVKAVGYTPLLGALIGMSILRNGRFRALVMGLGIGYAVFGLVFTRHIHTHGYYHAQLIQIVAISMSPLVTLVMDRLRQSNHPWYW